MESYMGKDTGKDCRTLAGLILIILAIACVYQLFQLEAFKSEHPYWMYDSYHDYPDKTLTLVIGGLVVLQDSTGEGQSGLGAAVEGTAVCCLVAGEGTAVHGNGCGISIHNAAEAFTVKSCG